MVERDESEWPADKKGWPAEVDWSSIEPEELEAQERVLLPGEKVLTGAERHAEIKAAEAREAAKLYVKLTPAAKKAKAAKWLVEGWSQNRIEESLGMAHGQVGEWLDRDFEEMKALMKQAQQREALLEISANTKRLKDLRESKNEETCRKAVADLQRIAGAPIDPAGAGGAAAVVVNAQNAQLNLMSLGELDKRLEKLAAELGEEGKKILDAELAEGRSGGSKNRGARRDEGAPPGAPAA